MPVQDVLLRAAVDRKVAEFIGNKQTYSLTYKHTTLCININSNNNRISIALYGRNLRENLVWIF